LNLHFEVGPADRPWPEARIGVFLQLDAQVSTSAIRSPALPLQGSEGRVSTASLKV